MTTVRRSIPTARPAETLEQAAYRTQRRLARTLEGRENFTGVLVNDQDVSAFLDKTDGEQLVNPSGLGAGVVETAAISTVAIRPSAPNTNAAAVNVNGLSAVGGDVNAAAATTVISATFTVPDPAEVTISFQVSFAVTNSETSEMALFVDYAGVHSMAAIRAVEVSNPERYREINEPNTSGGGSSVAMTVVADVMAGAHTVLVLAMGENPNELVVPAGSASVEVYVR